MPASPTDILIEAILTQAPDPIIADMIRAAQRDIARRHAVEIRSDVNADRCGIRIAVQFADGSLRFLV